MTHQLILTFISHAILFYMIGTNANKIHSLDQIAVIELVKGITNNNLRGMTMCLLLWNVRKYVYYYQKLF